VTRDQALEKMTESAADAPTASCSVVIPTAGRPDELERCLEAVSHQIYPAFDVIVVDNSVGDPRTEAIARRWQALYVKELKRGHCRARNRGALVSTANIIAYLDDDSVPEPGWLAGIAEAFRDPRVMGVGGRTIPFRVESDAEQLFARIRGSAYNRPAPLVVDRGSPHWFEICNFGGIGPGCNMAIRRAAFEVWPGFHERIGRGTRVHGGDEHHAFFSLVSLGFRVAYTPDAIVRHPFPPTMESLRSRYLKDITASTAYITMMLVEGSGHRRSTLRYLWEALRGTKRTWRSGVESPPRVVPRLSTAYAMLLGPVKYFQGMLLDPRS
jgi:cellulose synthase/poly-beta-1,6-N-acetylglucosamine synthase-like glycosyltransferase